MIYTKEESEGLVKWNARAGDDSWIYLVDGKLVKYGEKQKGKNAAYLVKYSVYGAPVPNRKLFAVGLQWEGETKITILPHKYSKRSEAEGAANGLMQVPNVISAHVLNIAADFNQDARILANPELDPEKYAMLNGECG